MIDEIEKVQKNIASFMASLETTSADTRAVMITGIDPALGSPLASDQGRYRFLQSEVDSKMLFTVALTSFGNYEDFLRPNAATHFVMVTDDDDLVPPDAFRTQMEAQLGHTFTLHAVASESVNGRPCANPICGGIPIPAVCGAASVGAAYNSVASDTGGQQLSICTEDWTSVFDQLRSAVVAGVPLPCDYPLAAISNGKFEPTEVKVVYTPAVGAEREIPKAKSESTCGKEVGWHYDSESDPGTVILCPNACTLVRGGGAMDIAFGCQPQILL
jgi:hypothetical protein